MNMHSENCFNFLLLLNSLCLGLVHTGSITTADRVWRGRGSGALSVCLFSVRGQGWLLPLQNSLGQHAKSLVTALATQGTHGRVWG